VSITAVFTNWRRQENLKQILDQVLSQTVKPKIFIWNNAESFDYPNVDWQVNSSLNVVAWGRWFMASMADTEYVCVMDDDIIFNDSKVLQEAIGFLKDKNSNMIIGPYGVNFSDISRDYKSSQHINCLPDKDRYVDMIKGRTVILKREALRNICFIKEYSQQYLMSDDLIVSAQTAKGKRHFHCVPSLFYGRVKDLPAPFALCVDDNEHYISREKARREFFRPNLKERSLDKLQAIKSHLFPFFQDV